MVIISVLVLPCWMFTLTTGKLHGDHLCTSVAMLDVYVTTGKLHGGHLCTSVAMLDVYVDNRQASW